MNLTHLNPAGLHTNPAFSNDLGEQTKQAFRNVLAVLAEAGADQRNVARLNIHLQAGGDVTAGYQAAAEVWGQHPTAITVLQQPSA